MGSGAFTVEVVEKMLGDDILAAAKFENLARLVPHLSRRSFAPGDVIYQAGETATHLFLVVSGVVELARTGFAPELAPGGRIGDEAATDLGEYISTAVALSPVETVALPRHALAEAIRPTPDLKTRFYYSLVHEGNSATPARPKPAAVPIKPTEIIGWMASLLLPAAVLGFGHRMLGLEGERLLFMAVFASVVSMWAFQLVDDYIPVIFALLASAVLGLAPPSVVLGGFGSDGFLMAMSILGLGTVMSASGLSYRVLLWCLRRVPDKPFWHNLVLVFIGLLLTPTVPSINGRVGLMLPSLVELADEVKAKPGGAMATRLSIGMFTGVTALSAVFLTSKSVNFVVFGLLPPQGQDVFQWSYWALAASVSGLTMMAGYFLMDQVLARRSHAASLPRALLDTQISLLGPVTRGEWAAFLGVFILIAGIATQSLHKVAPPWLGVAVLYGLLLLGFLRKNQFREHIDWPFLVYMAGSSGIIATFNYLGLDRWVAAQIGWVAVYMRQDFVTFLGVLAGLMFVVRLAVPISAAVVLFAAILMPMAETAGVNPWVVGFAVLTLGEMWFLPYQCSYYSQMRAATAQSGLFDERKFLLFNLGFNLLRLAGLYASVPFWKMLGLL